MTAIANAFKTRIVLHASFSALIHLYRRCNIISAHRKFSRRRGHRSGEQNTACIECGRLGGLCNVL